MFSMRERRKGEHKFGGTKNFKAEEVRKYLGNFLKLNMAFSVSA